MNCYQVWFKNGNMLCLDAEDEQDAKAKALNLIETHDDRGHAYEPAGLKVARVECLGGESVPLDVSTHFIKTG